MFETKSQYHQFVPLIRQIVELKERQNLSHLLDQSFIRRLFLHSVNHPMGYEDGPSGISVERMKRRAAPLTLNQRKKLYQIAEYAIRSIEQHKYYSAAEEKKAVLLGANQLIQNSDFNPRSFYLPGKSQLERIAGIYATDSSIGRVKEWDAQSLENQGFYHIRKGGEIGPSTLGMMGTFPAMILTGAILGYHNTNPYHLSAFMAGTSCLLANNFLLLPFQELLGEKNSPNTSENLITNRHYAFIRHPLYASRIIGNILFSIASFPVGTYWSLQGIYHNIKGCERQDERMKVLHGKKATLYQKRTPAIIPGSKFFTVILRKIFPTRIGDLFDKPVSYLLEQIPGIKDENYYTNYGATHSAYYRGKPHVYIGTALDHKVWKNGFTVLGESFRELGNMIFQAGKYLYKKLQITKGKNRIVQIIDIKK